MRSMQKVVHEERLGGSPVSLGNLAHKYSVKSLTAMIRAHDAARNMIVGPFEFTKQITTGGLAALGGSVTARLNRDGSIEWKGTATNSGIDSYTYIVNALIKAANGRTIALVHRGSIPNRVPLFPVVERTWDEIGPPQPLLKATLSDFSNARFETRLDYDSGIGSALEGAVSWLIKFAVGTALGPVGAVIFVGVEAGSLIMSGSLVPGARVVEGILWMAGPLNTLFALAAEGIAAAGTQTREISQEEYDWANNQVYLGSLPPRDRLVLTDTIGPDDRAFTFPRFDGKITLNMGPSAFADPRLCNTNHPNPKKKKPFGNVFIHELVHSCQIQHAKMDLALLGDALASKVCEATGGDPYTYGPAGTDYTVLHLEQQAQIISDWFSGLVPQGTNQSGTPMDPNSPYFRYVTENVRVGNF